MWRRIRYLNSQHHGSKPCALPFELHFKIIETIRLMIRLSQDLSLSCTLVRELVNPQQVLVTIYLLNISDYVTKLLAESQGLEP